jgi:hypothetical protein
VVKVVIMAQAAGLEASASAAPAGGGAEGGEVAEGAVEGGGAPRIEKGEGAALVLGGLHGAGAEQVEAEVVGGDPLDLYPSLGTGRRREGQAVAAELDMALALSGGGAGGAGAPDFCEEAGGLAPSGVVTHGVAVHAPGAGGAADVAAAA